MTKPVDVLIATPDSLLKLKEQGSNNDHECLVFVELVVFLIDMISFSDVSHLVLDEADSLFDQSFEDTTFNLLKMMKVNEFFTVHNL